MSDSVDQLCCRVLESNNMTKNLIYANSPFNLHFPTPKIFLTCKAFTTAVPHLLSPHRNNCCAIFAIILVLLVQCDLPPRSTYPIPTHGTRLFTQVQPQDHIIIHFVQSIAKYNKATTRKEGRKSCFSATWSDITHEKNNQNETERQQTRGGFLKTLRNQYPIWVYYRVAGYYSLFSLESGYNIA